MPGNVFGEVKHEILHLLDHNSVPRFLARTTENLDNSGARHYVVWAAAFSLVTVALTLVATLSSATRWARVALLPLFFASVLNFLQFWTKVSVSVARVSVHLRDEGDGTLEIPEALEYILLARVRRIYVASLISSVICLAAAVALPESKRF